MNPEQDTAQVGDNDLKKEIQALRDEVRELAKLLREAIGPDVKEGATLKANGALIEALNTCVTCHAENVAKKKGEGFVLFNLQKNPDTDKDEYVFRENFIRRELRSMEREISADTMPKRTSGKKLTKEQKEAMLEEIRVRVNKLEQDDKK